MKRVLLAPMIALSACGSQTTVAADRDHSVQTAERAQPRAQYDTHLPDTAIKPASKTTPSRETEPPKSRKVTCFLSVDGKTQVDGTCLVYPMGDRGYTLNTWSNGKPRQSHFAVVSANPDGTATASWNADPNDDRASDSLGDVRWSNGCWINRRVRICSPE